jgi:hypothetical protein
VNKALAGEQRTEITGCGVGGGHVLSQKAKDPRSRAFCWLFTSYFKYGRLE